MAKIKLSKVVRKDTAASPPASAEKKAPAPRKKKPPRKVVLFVCTGNTCRSPMAELLFRDFVRGRRELSRFEISSAGLNAVDGDPMTETAVEALREMGVEVRLPHPARRLTREKAERADLVVCMTAMHAAALAEFGPKVVTVAALTGGKDVPDPFGGDLPVYAKTAEYLRYAAREAYAALTKD